MKHLKRLSAVLLAFVMIFALAACGDDTATDDGEAGDAAYEQMTGEELDEIQGDNKKKEDYFVIDVRPVEEYDEGHVRHAVNIPLDDIEANLEDIKGRGETIVTICNTGNKSNQAAETLAAEGLEVYNAEGVKEYDYENIVTYTNITGQEMEDLDKTDVTVIDARDPEDYEAGHLEGAINMSVDNIDSSVVEEGKPVYTYCYSGNKSGVIAEELSNEGYEVTNAIDGTKEFDGYTLVTE